MSLFSSACFQPVGQGGFYTATIGQRDDWPKRQFHLVYDCGTSNSRSKLKKICRGYAATSEVNRIDALVISHFHADHVNGLDYLLSAEMPTRQVFLPYLSPIERLLCSLRNPDETKKYYAFLADPVGFLTGRGVQQVVFVSGGQEPPDEEDFQGPPDEPRKPSRGVPRIDISYADRDPRAEAVYNSDHTEGAHTPIFITDRKPVFLAGIWKFRFFNERELFVDLGSPAKIAELLTEEPSSEDERKFKKFLQKAKKILGSLSAKSITSAIARKGKRKLLRKIYKPIQKAHNDVSLALWHGPVVYPNQEVTTSARGSRAQLPLRLFTATSSRRTVGHGGGTMLTGDLTLLNVIADKFRRHFRQELANTSLFDLPHHGSGYSWDTRAIPLDSHPIFVVSAGQSNDYGHPDPGVLASLEQRYDGPALWSHEGADIRTSVTVESPE